MKTRTLMFSLLIAAGAALMPAAGHADSRVSIGIAIGPPAPLYVAPPPPHPGYAWAPGYWGWDGYRHVWVEGRWLAARPGYVWLADRWHPRGPRWHHSRGYWAPDRYPHRHHRGHRH